MLNFGPKELQHQQRIGRAIGRLRRWLDGTPLPEPYETEGYKFQQDLCAVLDKASVAEGLSNEAGATMLSNGARARMRLTEWLSGTAVNVTYQAESAEFHGDLHVVLDLATQAGELRQLTQARKEAWLRYVQSPLGQEVDTFLKSGPREDWRP